MKTSVTNVFKNISDNKALLYTSIVYFIILFILILFLLYIYSQQEKITGMLRVTPPMGNMGVDKPKDA